MITRSMGAAEGEEIAAGEAVLVRVTGGPEASTRRGMRELAEILRRNEITPIGLSYAEGSYEIRVSPARAMDDDDIERTVVGAFGAMRINTGAVDTILDGLGRLLGLGEEPLRSPTGEKITTKLWVIGAIGLAVYLMWQNREFKTRNRRRRGRQPQKGRWTGAGGPGGMGMRANPSYRLKPGDKGFIRWSMGNESVGLTDDNVIDLWTKRTTKMTKGQSSAVIRYALECHHRNQKEYTDVMGGRIR
jgi:hypothetical protein